MSNGAPKARRQQAILSLVGRERLGSQGEIRLRLRGLGLEATQSTISRDIEELGLARIHDREGLRYVLPGPGPEPRASHRVLRHLLDEFAVGWARADAGLVIRTPPGAAAALAEGIDRAEFPDVAGTIAGDNTILVLGREGVSSDRLENLFEHVEEE